MMQNILKISILAAGLGFGTTLNAQEDIKTAAPATASKLETPVAVAAPASEAKSTQEPAKKQEPVKTTKQEPAKSSASTPAPAPAAASKTEKVDSSQSGGATRMAISEQGLPKKKKRSAAPSATPSKK